MPVLSAAEPDLIQVEKPTPVRDGAGPRLVESSALIRAVEARQEFNVSGKGLTVVVIDSGINADHLDFAGRIVATRDFTDVGSPVDRDGHGTHVAGIIAANGPHVGIAPGANIIALRVLKADGSGRSPSLDRALKWVIENRREHNIGVVNMSLGVAGTNLTDYDGDDPVAANIRTLRHAGIAPVIAAGNAFFALEGAPGMSFPAAVPECISVGAVYSDNIGTDGRFPDAIAFSTGPDRICPFSQRLAEGDARTDIFAPGGAVVSAGIESPTSGASLSGTSMSAPMVSGAILLMQEYFLRETGRMPPVEYIENALYESGVTIKDGDDEDDNVTNTTGTYKRLDVLNLLRSLRPNADFDGDGISDVFDRDFDGDGYPNETEVLFETDPKDPSKFPEISGIAPAPRPLNVTSLSIALFFAKQKPDDITLAGTVPIGKDFFVPGQPLLLIVGGVPSEFVLDGKGKNLVLSGKQKLGVKFNFRTKFGVAFPSEAVKFTAKIQGDFIAPLVDETFLTADFNREPAAVTVELFFDGRYYQTSVPMVYSNKAFRSGRAWSIK